jgi:uncharacterized membrane-anchored protein
MANKAASLFALIFLTCSGIPAIGQPATPQQPAAAQSPVDPKREAENKQMSAAIKHGPADIALRDEAILKLPKGDAFLPPKEAAILMNRMGNITGESFLGLILPEDGGDWFVVAEFDDSGYVKDEEGKNIDADKLLQGMKDGTEEENKARAEKGMDPLRITRWIERPHYDRASRHLVWSIELETLDSKGGVKDTNLNYNTYALGRAGVINLKLVTGVDTVEKNKAYVRQLLSNLTFKPGKRYEDFNASTDKVAAYGLLALIGGVAVKKLGRLALAGVFFAKFAKVIAVAVFGGLAVFRKFFRWKKDENVATEPSAATPAPPHNDPPPPIVS